MSEWNMWRYRNFNPGVFTVSTLCLMVLSFWFHCVWFCVVSCSFSTALFPLLFSCGPHRSAFPHTCSASPSLAFPSFQLCFSASLHLHLIPSLVLPVCKPVCSTLSLSVHPVCYTGACSLQGSPASPSFTWAVPLLRWFFLLAFVFLLCIFKIHASFFLFLNKALQHVQEKRFCALDNRCDIGWTDQTDR